MYENFEDYYCFPQDETYKNLKLTAQTDFEFENRQATSFYDSETYLKTTLFDYKEQKEKEVQLIPIGKTTLRKVTFPKR